jgi:hypothetical protein
MAVLKTCHATRKVPCGSNRLAAYAASLRPAIPLRNPCQLILQADIYEEEDATPNSLGLYLGENLKEEDALYLLTEAEALLGAGEGAGPHHEQLLRLLQTRRLWYTAVLSLTRFDTARWKEDGDTCRDVLRRLRESLLAVGAAMGAQGGQAAGQGKGDANGVSQGPCRLSPCRPAPYSGSDW